MSTINPITPGGVDTPGPTQIEIITVPQPPPPIILVVTSMW